MTAKLFRVVIPVRDVERGAAFYSVLLDDPGERVSDNRHYFDCGGVILACVEPREPGREFRPNPDHVDLAVADLDAAFERARRAGCNRLDDAIATQHWGERSFFLRDPFDNPIHIVDEKTMFTGGQAR